MAITLLSLRVFLMDAALSLAAIRWSKDITFPFVCPPRRISASPMLGLVSSLSRAAGLAIVMFTKFPTLKLINRRGCRCVVLPVNSVAFTNFPNDLVLDSVLATTLFNFRFGRTPSSLTSSVSPVCLASGPDTF